MSHTYSSFKRILAHTEWIAAVEASFGIVELP